MNTTVQLLISAACVIALVNADKIIKSALDYFPRLTYRINTILLRKSYLAALADARELKAKGQKVFLLLWDGNWEAMPKQNFKQMWHSRPGMKKNTIQEWQRKMIEV